MSGAKTTKDGFGIVGIAIAACAACCAGPILAFVGGLSLAGAVSSLVVGVAGLGVAAAAAGAYIVVRGRRGQTSCSTDHVEPVPIATPSRTIPSG